MSDFSDLENELQRLRPAAPSARLFSAIERALEEKTDLPPPNVIAPDRFKVNWLGLGLGLAAAATFLIFARFDLHLAKKTTTVAAASPGRSSLAPAQIPSYETAGLTQVVYNRRDEGLVFPRGFDVPARRVRTSKLETLQWRDAKTGARLRVSYPTEEITLTPVAGQ